MLARNYHFYASVNMLCGCPNILEGVEDRGRAGHSSLTMKIELSQLMSLAGRQMLIWVLRILIVRYCTVTGPLHNVLVQYVGLCCSLICRSRLGSDGVISDSVTAIATPVASD